MVQSLTGQVAQHEAGLRQMVTDLEGRLQQMIGSGHGVSLPNSSRERLQEGVRQVEFSLHPLLQALEQQGDAVVERVTHGIYEALATVGNGGVGDGVSEETLVGVVRQEGERFFARHKEMIGEALATAVARMGETVSSLAALGQGDGDRFRVEMERLLVPLTETVTYQGGMVQQQLRDLQDRLQGRLDQGLGSVVATVEVESSRAWDEYRGMNGRALQELTQRLREEVTSGLRDVLGDTLALREKVGSERSEVLEGAAITAVMQGLRRMMDELSAHQDDRMSGLMADFAAQLHDHFSQAWWQSTIREGMRREHQSGDRIVEELLGQIQDALHQSVAAMEKKLALLGNELKQRMDQSVAEVSVGSAGEVDTKALLLAIRREMLQVTDAHDERIRETLVALMQESAGLLSLKPVLDAVAALSNTLVQRLDAATAQLLDEVQSGDQQGASGIDWQAFGREQGVWLARHRELTEEFLLKAHEEWREMQVGVHQVVAPVLEVIQEQGQQLLSQQEGVLRQRLDSLLTAFKEMLKPEVLRTTLREELAGFGQSFHWDQPDRPIQPEDLVTQFRDQMGMLVEGQTEKLVTLLQS
ncbi:MAG: hypothetical protein HQL66_15675, partial [Magnetococcales bacterium]|nr:hypothetical protein [Magnetococcales bacterium]